MTAERAYLDETALVRFLRERLDSDVVSQARCPDVGRQYRLDYLSKRFQMVVEFDGHDHYQKARNVVRDERRDAAVRGAGFEIIRIPYFVQLDARTIPVLFGHTVADTSPFKDFPHGFIARNVVMPCDFCELGIRRFRNDLERFSAVRPDILKSLRDAEAERGDWRTVYPHSLTDLVHPAA